MRTANEERNYAAFISYRHRPVDREAAVAVQKKIEHFNVPAQYRDKTGGSRIGYCFRDEDELPASSSLSDSIRYALDHANYLIVICTPDLPKSKWCEEEIRYFLSTHDRDHVLAVLAWGEPEESFSPLLTHVYDEEGNVIGEVEPLAANIVGTERHISKAKFRKESVRICAALIGCPFDELWQRERRYRTRRLAALAGVVFAGLSVFAGVVTVKNLQITRQNIELKTHEGRLLVDGGRLLLDGKDPDAAAENALQALAIDQVHTEGAEKLLADARGAYAQETLRYSTLSSQESPVDSYAVSDDRELVFTADQYGVVRSFDRNGEEKWAVSAVRPQDRIGYMDSGCRTEVVWLPESRAVLCGNAYEVLCLSAEDGGVLWELVKRSAVDFFAVSEDRSKFAVFDAVGSDEVAVYSTADGAELVRLGFPAPGEDYYSFYNLGTSSFTCNFGGSFTKDGRYFALAAGVQSVSGAPEHDPETWKAGNLSKAFSQNEGSGQNRDALLIYCVVDTEEKTGWMAGSEEIRFGFNPVFGMDYDPQAGRLYFARKDDLEGKIAAGVIDKDRNVTYTVSSDNITMNRIEVPRFYLEGNEIRAVCAADEIYVFSRDDNSFLGRYETGEQIIGAWWLDEEEDVLFTVQKDGTYHAYPLRSESNFLINGKMQTGELCSAAGVDGGFWKWVPEQGTISAPDGALLYVDSSSPGKVIEAELFTDPHVSRILSDHSYSALSNATVTGDGSRLVITQTGSSGSGSFQVLDLETGGLLRDTVSEKTRAETFGDRRKWGILRDGEAVISGNIIWTPGGEAGDGAGSAGPAASGGEDDSSAAVASGDGAGFLEGTSQEDPYSFRSRSDVSTMRDGSVLTAYVTTKEDGTGTLYLWKDGAGLAGLSSEGKQVLFGDSYSGAAKPGSNILTRTGGNGLAVIGLRESGEDVYSAYMVADAGGGTVKTSVIDCAGGAIPGTILRFADESKCFAAVEEDGVLRIYDAEGGSGQPQTSPRLEITDPEKFSGTVSMAFADHDRYLCLLSYSGEFRMYDAVSGECVIRELNPQFATEYGTMELYTNLAADGTKLVVRATETEQEMLSNGALFSLDRFERLADIPDMIGFSEKTNELILFRKNYAAKEYYTCPLYSVQELVEWSREAIK